MSTVNDGGPAFPSDFSIKQGDFGISVRDYFAAKAMHALIVNDSQTGIIPTYSERAYVAYLQADAMLKERNKNE